jgi:hypothetical protein
MVFLDPAAVKIALAGRKSQDQTGLTPGFKRAELGRHESEDLQERAI